MPYITRRQPVKLRGGKRTSVRLELEFFRALRLIAITQGISMSELIRRIEAEPRSNRQPLPSRARCYAITWLMDRMLVAKCS
jgi:predicted DNA-binding ribbon-helix-helix protein